MLRVRLHDTVRHDTATVSVPCHEMGYIDCYNIVYTSMALTPLTFCHWILHSFENGAVDGSDAVAVSCKRTQSDMSGFLFLKVPTISLS